MNRRPPIDDGDISTAVVVVIVVFSNDTDDIAFANPILPFPSKRILRTVKTYLTNNMIF